MSAEAFAETGMAAPLAVAASTLGFDRPTPLQAAALPIVRRGGNLVLRGAPGSGVTLAWGAGVLERAPSIGEGTPGVLVVTRDTDRAASVADVLTRLAAAAGPDGDAWRDLRIGAVAPGWRADGAALLVVPIEAAAAAIAASKLKLDGVAILVLDDAPALLGHGEAIEALLTSVPRDAQRILVTPDWSEDVERLAEVAVRKALHVPSRPDGEPAEPTAQIGVRYVPERSKLDALCEILSGRQADDDVVIARTRARAARLAEDLARRGFGDGGPAVASFADTEAASIAWDVPFSAEGLARLAGQAPVILATPAERRHLRQIAADARRTPRSLPGPRPTDGAAAWRQRIEDALEREDIDAHLALLAPLFERHSPPEVAAALSALLRSRPDRPAQPAAAGAPPPQPRFARVFISAGGRDGLRPADLLGAITGESGIAGDRVGRIDIRDTFSVAEIGEDVAEQVIRALNGTTLRGRAVRVDYDRPRGAAPERRKRVPRT